MFSAVSNVPRQLCDGAQSHSSPYKSTGKGAAVAMPAIDSYIRFFERRRKSQH
jgi:hypothetical protein